MKKNILKYIFITLFAVCMSFGFVNGLKAETKTINIGTTASDIFYAEKSALSGYVLYVYGNTAYGDLPTRQYYQEILKSVCETGKWESISKDGDMHLKCNFSNIRADVVINYNPDKVPLSLSYDTQSEDIKTLLSDGCFCYTDTDTQKTQFVCTKYTACSNFCNGTCEEIKLDYVDGNGYLSLSACKKADLKQNIFLQYSGINSTYSSWDNIKGTNETFIDGSKKYFAAFTDDGSCHGFFKTRLLEYYDDKSARSGTTTNEGAAFLDDWDSIPAVLNGMADITDGKLTCDSDALQGLIGFLEKIFIIVKIGAVLFLVVLTAMDFMKSVSASDDKDLKKAVQHFIKRAIILVCIVILPSLINLIFKIIEINNGNCNIV